MKNLAILLILFTSVSFAQDLTGTIITGGIRQIPSRQRINLLTEEEQPPKEFEVTFVITYNSITLEKAAQLEKEIKKKFGDACGVDVKVKEVQGVQGWIIRPNSICVDSVSIHHGYIPVDTTAVRAFRGTLHAN